MSADALLARLETSGITLRTDGESLRVNAARGAIDPALRAEIAAHKAAIIDLLKQRQAPAPRAAADLAGTAGFDPDAAHPLSLFQERLFVLSQLQPDDTAFNLIAVIPITGGIDPTRLAEALRLVAQRHAILRARFVVEADGPVMRHLPAEAIDVEIHDHRTLPVPARQAAVEAAMERANTTPIDLAAGPVTRFAVHIVDDELSAVLLSSHHIVLDAWSLNLLRRDIAEAVHEQGAPAAGSTDAACPQYAQYAAWQRIAAEQPKTASDLAWWADALRGIPDTSVFPRDRTGSEKATGGSVDVDWNASQAEGIRRLCRRTSTTLYMALVAATAAVLHRHTGQTDVVLGSPMGVRERPEFESIVGPFVNLLLMRLDLSDDPTFETLLHRTRSALLDAHEHRDVPFELLLEHLKPTRSPDHAPLFQMAVVQHDAGPEQAEPATRIFTGGSMHDLTWFATERGDTISNRFEYRSDLYDAATVQRIVGHLGRLLQAASGDPTLRVSQLPLLDDAERAQLLVDFNATDAASDAAPFIHRFERQAIESPEAVAVSCQGEVTTYRELERLADQLARRLRRHGIGRGAIVAVCAERSAAMVAALLAVQKCAATYLPLDPAFPAERIRYMLDDSSAAALLSTADLAEDLALEDGGGMPVVLDIGDEEPHGHIEGSAPDATHAAAQPGDAAYLIYTSGSTGKPKGVAVSHGALSNFLCSMQKEPGLDSRDILAAVTTISFDIAGLELYLPLMVGARIELVPREASTDGEELAALLASSGATVLQATPGTWRLLIEAGWQGGPEFKALCGGEAMPIDLAEALLARVGTLWNLYGPTETTIWSTAARLERGDKLISIGKPIANTRVYVVDESGAPTPIGVPGEILIAGHGLAIGYHGREALTAERFTRDPFVAEDNARVYRTGDLGCWMSDGRLRHLGRIDQQLKIRGFRIEPGEIEAVLSTHPAVRQSVVLARDAGPGDPRLVAYVVFKPGEEPTVSEVRRHLRRELPDYMIPSVVVALDAIPSTPNGKVDRAALADPFRDADTAAARSDHIAPAAGLEQLLAELWTDMLKVTRVSAEDNFFELGGHSLLAVRVAASVQARTGWRMDPRTLFFNTLRQVAATAPAGVATATATTGDRSRSVAT